MTEPLSQPVFFVVDEDPTAVEALVCDLERRFQADYRVMGETSAQAALERLGALRESGEQVGADLSGARLLGAQLADVRTDYGTTWPAGFTAAQQA